MSDDSVKQIFDWYKKEMERRDWKIVMLQIPLKEGDTGYLGLIKNGLAVATIQFGLAEIGKTWVFANFSSIQNLEKCL